jgi:hypothetical protein
MLLFDITAVVGMVMVAIKRIFWLSFMEWVICCQQGS